MMIQLSRKRYVEVNAIIAVDDLDKGMHYDCYWVAVLQGGYTVDLSSYDRTKVLEALHLDRIDQQAEKEIAP